MNEMRNQAQDLRHSSGSPFVTLSVCKRRGNVSEYFFGPIDIIVVACSSDSTAHILYLSVRKIK